MSAATSHFESVGFEVQDVSHAQPYDLRCTRGDERVDVEVKGTTTSGETVLLTPNEVQHALATFPATALAIVRDIVLTQDEKPTAAGGTLEVIQPWRPLDTDLKPIGYTYTVPKAASG